MEDTSAWKTLCELNKLPKLTPSQILFRLNLDIEYFGYAHITWTQIEDNLIDINDIQKRKGWKLDKGMLIVTFSKGTPKTSLEFGKRPSAKELRKMKKELLKHLDIK